MINFILFHSLWKLGKLWNNSFANSEGCKVIRSIGSESTGWRQATLYNCPRGFVDPAHVKVGGGTIHLIALFGISHREYVSAIPSATNNSRRPRPLELDILIVQPSSPRVWRSLDSPTTLSEKHYFADFQVSVSSVEDQRNNKTRSTRKRLISVYLWI